MGQNGLWEKLYREEGVTLLLLRIRAEEAPPAAEATSARIGRAAEGYRAAVLSAGETLFSRLRQVYLADPSPKKRLLTRPISAEYRLLYLTDGGRISARHTLTLRRSGRVLLSLCEENSFDKDGYLLRKKRKSQRK